MSIVSTGDDRIATVHFAGSSVSSSAIENNGTRVTLTTYFQTTWPNTPLDISIGPVVHTKDFANGEDSAPWIDETKDPLYQGWLNAAGPLAMALYIEWYNANFDGSNRRYRDPHGHWHSGELPDDDLHSGWRYIYAYYDEWEAGTAPAYGELPYNDPGHPGGPEPLTPEDPRYPLPESDPEHGLPIYPGSPYYPRRQLFQVMNRGQRLAMRRGGTVILKNSRLTVARGLSIPTKEAKIIFNGYAETWENDELGAVPEAYTYHLISGQTLKPTVTDEATLGRNIYSAVSTYSGRGYALISQASELEPKKNLVFRGSTMAVKIASFFRCDAAVYLRWLDPDNYIRIINQRVNATQQLVLEERIAGVSSSISAASEVALSTVYDLVIILQDDAVTVVSKRRSDGVTVSTLNHTLEGSDVAGAYGVGGSFEGGGFRIGAFTVEF